MDIITQAISNADREARYLNFGELSAIDDFFAGSQNRLRIATILAANEQEIVQKGSQRFWERCPDTPSNSGNSIYRAMCLRDQSWYIRLITYSIVVGDIEPLEKFGLLGVQEMYNSLGVPLRNVVESMRCLKDIALEMLPIEDATEVSIYFNHLIQGMRP
jgi:allophycocyanin-B